MTSPRQGGTMSALRLTRAQRRLMQKLADHVDRVTQADRLFFERFPHRQHRSGSPAWPRSTGRNSSTADR